MRIMFFSILSLVFTWSNAQKEQEVLFEIGQEKVTAREFFDRYYLNNNEKSREILEELVLEHHIKLASQEHKIEVSQDDVYKLVQKELEYCREQANQLQLKLSIFLQTKLNMTESQFIKLAERRSRLRLLLGQIIRYEDGLEERIVLRICTIRTRESAEEVRKEALKGADFETLIKEHDINPLTRQTGGKSRPMSVKDFPPEYEDIKKIAFSLTPLTEISPVLEVPETDGKKTFVLVKVIEKRPAWKRPFHEVKSQILKDLEENPLAPQEINRWRFSCKDRWTLEANINIPSK